MSNNKIQESGLARVWSHNEVHDCGAMTAFRADVSMDDNRTNNRRLKATLLSAGYGVTSLKGIYPENGKPVEEESFFIVDVHDTGKLEKALFSLGKLFDQDSILFIPKGAIQNKAKAYLVGTNNTNGWINVGQTVPFSKGKLGYDSPIYTSYVNNRPFMFESVNGEVKKPLGMLGMIADKYQRDVNIQLSKDHLIEGKIVRKGSSVSYS